MTNQVGGRMQNTTTVTTDEEKDYLHNKFRHLVAKITSKMTTRDDKKKMWRYLKKEWNDELNEMMGVDAEWGVPAGQLFSFDLDSRRKLVLLNYTQSAHNVLHELGEGAGWTTALRLMRGLVFAYETPGDPDGVRMVSRSFRKFFNTGEVPDSTWSSLIEDAGDKPVVVRAKEDGAMLQYFMHNGKLCATTRGRIETQYVDCALGMFSIDDFNNAKHRASQHGIDLMTVVVELVHPISKVHVDYDGEESAYLLAGYDHEGNEVPADVLEYIALKIGEGGNTRIRMPDTTKMMLSDLKSEINDRSIENREGWVAFVGEGPKRRRVKFKYVTHIGDMVKSKLSYKYIMNCLRKERANRMLDTLPEEIRDVAYNMLARVEKIASESSSYKALYILHDENEGGRDYFRQVCRDYYRYRNPPSEAKPIPLPIFAA